MTTIDLTTAINGLVVPDAAGVEHTYDLAEGLQDVPPEVSEHWYVQRFCRPVRRVPRFVTPSSAAPAQLPAGLISTMADAVQSILPSADEPVDAPAPASDKKAKA